MSREQSISKLGLAPGTLVFTGTQKMNQVELFLIQYNEHALIKTEPTSSKEAIRLIQEFDGISWLNIDGLHDLELIEEISGFLGMHKLSKEDITSVNQRPKLEEYAEHLHLILRMISGETSEFEQVSFVLKDRLLVSFQEQSGDTFSHVRKRLNDDKAPIRKKGVDYLLYALLDSIVDYYFVLLEGFGEDITQIETELLESPQKESLGKIYQSRKKMLELRRSIYPMREICSKMERLSEPLISPELGVYLADLYDHTIRVVEGIEGYRDTVSGLVDLYMNSVSHRMNEIMKVLTIIATIFIPLTFIAGIYGMNFDYMPELHYRYAYFGALILMLLIVCGMIFLFRRRKWL